MVSLRSCIAAVMSVIIAACLSSSACGDTIHAGPFWSSGPSLWVSGNALDIDYASGDFILKDRGRLYIVLADQAAVQLPANKPAGLSSVKEGCFVRVRGEQLSSRTVFASLIIVMDETAKFQDLRTNSYFLDDGGLFGDVIWVSAPDNRLRFRVDSREYMVIIGPDTTITRFTRRTDIYSIFPTDRLRIVGPIGDGNTIRAESIVVVEPTSIARTRSDRRDVVTGTIVSLPSSPGGMLKLSTLYGVREVALSPGSVDMKRLSGALKAEDSKSTVSAHGVWRGRVLVADRVEVAEPAKDAPETSRTTKQKLPPSDSSAH